MQLSPEEQETKRLLTQPTLKSNIYGFVVLGMSLCLFAAGLISSDAKGFFAGAYVVAVYAFMRYLFAGVKYSESIRQLILKYDARIAELEANKQK